MGSNLRRSERQREMAAYMADDRVPDVERGGVLLALVAHAAGAMLLIGAQAAWCAVTAVRVWRRRDAGWTAAVRAGVHRPTLAGLTAATLAYAVLRRLGVAALIARARHHPARQGHEPHPESGATG
jgi:hypothetical protein